MFLLLATCAEYQQKAMTTNINTRVPHQWHEKGPSNMVTNITKNNKEQKKKKLEGQ